MDWQILSREICHILHGISFSKLRLKIYWTILLAFTGISRWLIYYTAQHSLMFGFILLVFIVIELLKVSNWNIWSSTSKLCTSIVATVWRDQEFLPGPGQRPGQEIWWDQKNIKNVLAIFFSIWNCNNTVRIVHIRPSVDDTANFIVHSWYEYLYITDRVLCVVPSQNYEDRPKGPLLGP